MKIKLRSNGQIINPPLRVAQRYIRLGKASVYKEPEPVIEKPKRTYKKKVKEAEENFESQITEGQELPPSEIQEG